MSFKNNVFRGWALGCVLSLMLWALIILGAYVVFAEPSLQVQSTYTPNPTYTAWATFTPCPTENVPTPTFTPLPTSTPYPTQTQYPDQMCPVVEPSVTPEDTHTPTPTEIPPTFTPTNTPIVSSGHYYVSISGSDSNSGTSGSPWRTIQKAANSTVTGNTVHVLAGDYSGRVYISTNGVTYIAEGDVLTQGFTVNADYVTIRGFEAANTSGTSTTDGHGIYLECTGCLIEDNFMNSTTWGGILVFGNNNIIRGNRTYRVGNHGIEVHGTNHLIENNEVERTIQYHPDMVNPPSWVDADGVIYFGSGHVFRGNFVHGISYDDPENVNSHSDAFQTWDDAYHTAASNVLFENNVIEMLTVQAAAERGHAFMIHQATNITIRNNVMITHSGINSGYGTSGLTIVNNVFVNDLSLVDWWPRAIELNNVPDAVVKNNILYNSAEYYMIVSGTTVGHDISNNIAYRSDGQSADCFLIDFCNVNPLFVNPDGWDFHLQPGSPAIDAGVDVGLPYNGAAPDIGAFEQ